MSSPIEDFIVSLGFDTTRIKSQIQDLHKSLEKLAIGVDAKRIQNGLKAEKQLSAGVIAEAEKVSKQKIDTAAKTNNTIVEQDRKTTKQLAANLTDLENKKKQQHIQSLQRRKELKDLAEKVSKPKEFVKSYTQLSDFKRLVDTGDEGKKKAEQLLAKIQAVFDKGATVDVKVVGKQLKSVADRVVKKTETLSAKPVTVKDMPDRERVKKQPTATEQKAVERKKKAVNLDKSTQRKVLERNARNAVAEYERGTVGPSNASQRLERMLKMNGSNSQLRAITEEFRTKNADTRNRMKAEGSLKSFDSAAASKADLDLLKANNAIATLRTTMQKLGMDTKELDKSLSNSKDLGSLKTLRENTATQIKQWKILNSEAKKRADIQQDADAHVSAFQKERNRLEKKRIRDEEVAARKVEQQRQQQRLKDADSHVSAFQKERNRLEKKRIRDEEAAARKAEQQRLKDAANEIKRKQKELEDKDKADKKLAESLQKQKDADARKIEKQKLADDAAKIKDEQKRLKQEEAAAKREEQRRLREAAAAARKAERSAASASSPTKTKITMEAITQGGGFKGYTSQQQAMLVEGAQRQGTQKGADAFVRAARDAERYRKLGGGKIDEAIASGNIDQLRTVTKELSRMNHELEKQRRHSIGAAAAMSSLQDSTRNMVREYASLYALFAGTTYFKEQIKALDSMNASILAVSDNSEQAAGTIEYLKGVIVQNGLSLKDTTKDFVKLRAAMQGKYSLDETKMAFESLTKSGVILQLSQDDMAGTVKAVSQMFSKQQVMAQELKEQLKLAA
jgi:hypothetical protein